MSVLKNLQHKAVQADGKQLIAKLGYPSFRSGERALGRFIEAPDLKNWLQSYSYDGIHGARSFIRKLAKVLNVDNKAFRKELETAEDEIDNYPGVPQPYIYVDTAFKRLSEPIFALAMMEGERRIAVDKAFVLHHNLTEVLTKVVETIRKHYAETEGKLLLWGTIRGYVYYHIDGERYEFDTKGNRTEGKLAGDNSRATLWI